MSAKIDYTRAELTSLKSQILALQTALGGLLGSIKGAEGLLYAREALGEEPKRENIKAKYAALSAGVASINGITLTVPTEQEFMAGYDAETNPPR